MIWLLKEKDNSTVTDFYMNTIQAALEQAGNPTTAIGDPSQCRPQKGDVVVAATATNALRLYPKCRRLIYWAQGIWPEESYMRNQSKLRFWIAGILEKWALSRAEFVFFVSGAMREFYEKKYDLSFEGRCYIMPCANESLHAECFCAPEKYEENTFCYAGSLSAWQCFEETIVLYRKIEERYPDSKLLLLVRDREKAMEYIQKYSVKNYEFDFVPVSQLPERLKHVKFGFVLRQPHPVNRVATPTKLLTYLANGLIPIYSDCLDGMQEIMSGTDYRVPYGNDGKIDAIEALMKETVSGETVLREYTKIYEKYYDSDKHIQQIAGTIGCIS